MNWGYLLPEIIVSALAVLVLVLDFSLPRSSRRRVLGGVCLAGLVASLISTLMLWGSSGELFGGLFVVDPLSVFFKIIFLSAAILVFLISFNYLERFSSGRGEFYWLAITALLGMMVTAAGQELITLYVGIELVSLSFYGLVGFRKESRDSTEAALKYFILGSFAIGLWLYGAALVYGVTGHTDLAGIAKAAGNGTSLTLYIGMFLLIAGLGFKMGLAPFHTWVPDAYQGAPTPITAFLAVGSKAAAFAVFLRVLLAGFGSLHDSWAGLLGFLSVLTMSWGNIAALRQTNIKRMLAYSGIAHAGYTLLGVVSASITGAQGVMIYLFGYLFATLGAFAVVVAFSNQTGSDEIADYAGLRWKNPFLAMGMGICLLSLAGIPPLTGFFGKLYLFWGAAQQGGWMLYLVVLAGINSAISLFYYVNVLRTMYFLSPKDQLSLKAPVAVNLTVAIALAGVLLGVVYFQPILSGLAATKALWTILGLIS